jgi:hypothetical protein
MECQICQHRYGYMIIHEGEDLEAKVISTKDNFSSIGNLVKEVHTVCLKCLMARAFKCEYCTRHCTKLVNILQYINEPDNTDYIYYDLEKNILPKLYFSDNEPYYPPNIKPGMWFQLTREFIEIRSKQNPNFDPESFPDLNLSSSNTSNTTSNTSVCSTTSNTSGCSTSNTSGCSTSNTSGCSTSNTSDKIKFPYNLVNISIGKEYYDSEFVDYIRKIICKKYDIYYSTYVAANLRAINYRIYEKKSIEEPSNKEYQYLVDKIKETFQF